MPSALRGRLRRVDSGIGVVPCCRLSCWVAPCRECRRIRRIPRGVTVPVPLCREHRRLMVGLGAARRLGAQVHALPRDGRPAPRPQASLLKHVFRSLTGSRHCRAEMSTRRVGHAHRGSKTHDDGMVVYFCCAQRLIVSNQFCRSVRTCLRSVFVQLVSRCIEASDGCTWRALQAESRSAP